MTKIFWRSIHYLRTGAGILAFPFTLLTFLTVAYDNLSFVGDVFGSFLNFILVMLPFFALGIGVFGWYWLKKSKFYKQELEIGVEVNPFQNKRLTPIAIPSFKALIRFFDREGVDCSEMKTLLEKTLKENKK